MSDEPRVPEQDRAAFAEVVGLNDLFHHSGGCGCSPLSSDKADNKRTAAPSRGGCVICRFEGESWDEHSDHILRLLARSKSARQCRSLVDHWFGERAMSVGAE